MSKEGEFLIFCAEIYKCAKNLTGKQLSDLFSRYGVWEYIYDFYEALHTTGEKYIVGDIDRFIEVRQN